MPSLKASWSHASTDKSGRSAPTSGKTSGVLSPDCAAEQLPDGGWNCEAANGSTRSSFNTTICVLEALLGYEHAGGGSPEVIEARLRGQEYLLERCLFRRLSTGAVIERDRKGGSAWTRFAFPTWWHYDVLRGLEYMRSAGVRYDERIGAAIELVAAKRDRDGLWPLEAWYPGVMLVKMDEGEGNPSRWNTLRALRVLHWFRQQTNADRHPCQSPSKSPVRVDADAGDETPSTVRRTASYPLVAIQLTRGGETRATVIHPIAKRGIHEIVFSCSFARCCCSPVGWPPAPSTWRRRAQHRSTPATIPPA